MKDSRGTKDQISVFKEEYEKKDKKTPFKLMAFLGNGQKPSVSYYSNKELAIEDFNKCPCRALLTQYGKENKFIRYKFQ